MDKLLITFGTRFVSGIAVIAQIFLYNQYFGDQVYSEFIKLSVQISMVTIFVNFGGDQHLLAAKTKPTEVLNVATLSVVFCSCLVATGSFINNSSFHFPLLVLFQDHLYISCLMSLFSSLYLQLYSIYYKTQKNIILVSLPTLIKVAASALILFVISRADTVVKPSLDMILKVDFISIAICVSFLIVNIKIIGIRGAAIYTSNNFQGLLIIRKPAKLITKIFRDNSKNYVFILISVLNQLYYYLLYSFFPAEKISSNSFSTSAIFVINLYQKIGQLASSTLKVHAINRFYFFQKRAGISAGRSLAWIVNEKNYMLIFSLALMISVTSFLISIRNFEPSHVILAACIMLPWFFYIIVKQLAVTESLLNRNTSNLLGLELIPLVSPAIIAIVSPMLNKELVPNLALTLNAIFLGVSTIFIRKYFFINAKNSLPLSR